MNTDYLILLRPHQWIKNTVVLAAIIFAQRLTVPGDLLRSLAAFAAFCMISSSVYIANDILDVEQDRMHPRKKDRPLARGSITPSRAATLGAILLAGGGALTALLGVSFALTVLAYLFLQAAYNLLLKRIVLLDIMAISLGFVIRAVAGGAAIHVTVSPWLILCTLLVALFLGFTKRRHEIVILGSEAGTHRSSLLDYSPAFLDQLIGIVTAATIVVYSIYTMSPEVTERIGSRYLVLTIPFVLYGMFRYLFLVHMKEKGGSAARDLLTDPPLLLSVFLWGLFSVILIYGEKLIHMRVTP